jgi:hypothetical protein
MTVPPIHMPCRREAANLSRMRSPATFAASPISLNQLTSVSPLLNAAPACGADSRQPGRWPTLGELRIVGRIRYLRGPTARPAARATKPQPSSGYGWPAVEAGGAIVARDVGLFPLKGVPDLGAAERGHGRGRHRRAHGGARPNAVRRPDARGPGARSSPTRGVRSELQFGGHSRSSAALCADRPPSSAKPAGGLRREKGGQPGSQPPASGCRA